MNAWAAVHTLQGKWAETERELQSARGFMRNASQTGDLLPSILHNLAAVEMRMGAYAEALDNEQEALSLWKGLLNSDHPHFVNGYATLGALQYLLGHPREAHRSLAQAIDSARKTYGPENSILADLLVSDSVILDRLKWRKEARQARDEARRIRGGKSSGESVQATWDLKEALAPDSAVYLRSR